MKRLFIVFVISSLALLLSSCRQEKVEPLVNLQVDLFSVIYEDTDFSILKRKVIDESQAYYMIAYFVGNDDETCALGQYHRFNFLIRYNDEYYDIVDADAFELYSCELLLDQDILSID